MMGDIKRNDNIPYITMNSPSEMLVVTKEILNILSSFNTITSIIALWIVTYFAYRIVEIYAIANYDRYAETKMKVIKPSKQVEDAIIKFTNSLSKVMDWNVEKEKTLLPIPHTIENVNQ